MKLEMAIIPIAGKGTRMRPITTVIPKSMLPINAKAAIEYAIMECISAGINKIFISTSPEDDLTERYLASEQKFSAYLVDEFSSQLMGPQILIRKCYQDKKGNGASLYDIRNAIKDNWFAVVFPDDIIFNGNPLIDIRNEMSRHSCASGIVYSVMDNVHIHEYGNVEIGDDGLLKRLVQKPKNGVVSPYVLVSHMIMNKGIFKYLDKMDGEFDIGQALDKQADRENVVAVPLHGEWVSIDTPQRYANAVNKALAFDEEEIMKNQIIEEPIINRHAAWIVMNPVQGCLNNCQYCFLQRYGSSSLLPKVLASPSQSVKQLLESKYYREDIPVCLFTSTDIFSTDSNIQYCIEMISYLSLLRLKNPVVFVTKCRIPTKVITMMKSSGLTIIVYISYSGLAGSLEGNISEEDIKADFMNLHAAGIPVIHYFRPILPENSTPEKISQILGFVHQYCNISVMSGLKVYKEYLHKMTFWPEVMKNPESTKMECVWPEGAQDRIKTTAARMNHYIFETNSCALACVLKEGDQYGFYQHQQCGCNLCPDEQRARCGQYYQKPMKIDRASIARILKEELSEEALKGNDAITIKENISNEDICQLRYLLHKEIKAEKQSKDFYWQTSVTGARGLTIGK